MVRKLVGKKQCKTPFPFIYSDFQAEIWARLSFIRGKSVQDMKFEFILQELVENLGIKTFFFFFKKNYAPAHKLSTTTILKNK